MQEGGFFIPINFFESNSLFARICTICPFFGCCFYLCAMKIFATAIAGVLLLLLTGCESTGGRDSNKPGSYVSVHHARGFKIWHTADGYEVMFRNPQDTTEVFGTLVLSRKTFAERQADTLTIPVKRAALGSTTFIAYFDRIGQVDAIGAITYADRVLNPNLRARIEQGHAKDITDANGIDFEKLLAAQPDLFMAYPYGATTFERYREQGIPVAMNMEYLESTPLARAEWVLLAGALTDQLDKSIEIFNQLEQNYIAVQALTAQSSYKPSVFTGTRYGSEWFTPGNKSYIAQFIRDAGATYAFEHVEGQGNVQLDFESVVSIIAYADFWGLLVSSDTKFALSNVLEMEAEYVTLNSFKKGQIFVCNTAKTDYFGDAVMAPDVILRDIVAILHPDLIPGHVHVYFHPVVIDVAI